MVAATSACTLMMSAPAFAKSGTRNSGSTIICDTREMRLHGIEEGSDRASERRNNKDSENKRVDVQETSLIG